MLKQDINQCHQAADHKKVKLDSAAVSIFVVLLVESVTDTPEEGPKLNTFART